MRKIIFLILSVVILTACVQDEKDLFDENASKRMEQALQATSDVLTSAENGWLMDYYPEEDYKIGGYALLMKFHENGEVEVASEVAVPDFPIGKVAKSTFEMLSDRGPVISFSTYNSVFHHFSEPKPGDNKGLQGDYEFIILSAKADSVKLKGKKHGNIITMTPFPAGKNWKTYLTEVVRISEESGFGTYKVTSGTENIGTAEQNNRTFDIMLDDTTMQSFTYTDKGLKLREPFDVDGTEVQNFTWDIDSKAFKSVEGNISLIVNLPENYIPYADYLGAWTLQYGVPTNRQRIDVVLTELSKNKSILVSGPNLPFDFQLDYLLKSGMISYVFHTVGEYDGKTVGLAAWDTVAGYLTWGAGIGAIGKINSKSPITVSFVDNGVWGTNSVSGFLFWTFDASGASAGAYSGPGVSRFVNPVFIKK